MQTDLELSSTQSLLFSHEDEEKEFAEIAAKISEDLDFKLTFLGLSSDHQGEESEQVEEERDHNDVSDADDDFSFVINGSDPNLVSDTSIRPYFPLFNRDLLLAREDYKTSDHKSVSKPPVGKIFIETTSPAKKGENNSETDDTVNGIATGPYCAWEKTSPDHLSKKSNSTGFSKLWRFKEYLSRSHSDGNDAFVFLNKPVHKKTAEVKVSSDGEKKVVKKVKKSRALSSHEIYLRSKGIYPENDKRRSYLPYKPEVVGFFTSVNGGGLSKNVHPY